MAESAPHRFRSLSSLSLCSKFSVLSSVFSSSFWKAVVSWLRNRRAMVRPHLENAQRACKRSQSQDKVRGAWGTKMLLYVSFRYDTAVLDALRVRTYVECRQDKINCKYRVS